MIAGYGHAAAEQPHFTSVALPSFWEQAGIFTLASQFGDDDTKGGELEALLQQIDPRLLHQAHRECGGRKPRAVSYFAASHPDPPDAVLELYKKISQHLNLR